MEKREGILKIKLEQTYGFSNPIFSERSQQKKKEAGRDLQRNMLWIHRLRRRREGATRG